MSQINTKLDRLNKLLKNPALKLPPFRQEVSASFSNLKWLREKLPANAACPQELLQLIQLDPRSLLGAYEQNQTG